MRDFIFIAGAPGSGKSSVAKALQQTLNSPLFEFGWIPEFRHTGSAELTYTEEESLAFENLVLVAKNYAKHGYKNVIITDLNNQFVEQLPELFAGYDFAIYTLRVANEAVLKARVLDDSRSSGYRDWQKALEINAVLQAREPYVNEQFIDVNSQTVEDITEHILAEVCM